MNHNQKVAKAIKRALVKCFSWIKRIEEIANKSVHAGDYYGHAENAYATISTDCGLPLCLYVDDSVPRYLTKIADNASTELGERVYIETIDGATLAVYPPSKED